jgi:hypothetical protein
MTLDEAIKHAEEVAKVKEREAKINRNHGGWAYDNEATKCSACAEEHRQLAEWLKELKQTRLIPVSERMPEFTIESPIVGKQFTEDVLVYDGAEFRVGYLVKDIGLDYDYWVVYGMNIFEPIAWMPLPKSYKASPTGAESEKV